MKRTKRVAAWLLAFVMVLTATLSAAPATVSAKSATVKSITVKSSLSGSKKKVYVAKGKTVKLSTTVKVTPNKKANKKVTYKSKNTKIATVNAKGVVKGVKAGNTKITVTSKTDKKKKTTIKVKVTKAPVKKIKMTSASAVLNKGASLKLKAKVTAKKGAVKTLKWKSSNKKVATVSQKGVVKAVAAGTATITAAAIDGSGKKATCKITVSDAVNLTGMTIQNSYTISFSLSKAKALTTSQVTLKAKALANGAYRGNIKLESLTTNDKINYTLILEDRLSMGEYAQLSIPSLTGTKTLERQYLKAACAFTGDYTCSGRVGEKDSWDFGFDEGIGYSQFSISGLPAGLKAESYSRGLTVSGTPTKAGVTKAVLKAVDEVGDTLTQNVYFVIGSDKVLAGAAAPVYTLASDNNTYGSYPRVSGGSGYYTYQITADPQGTGATIDSDGDVYVSLKVPGTYKVTVKVTDGNNPALSCNVTMEYHVAQGVSIGGCVRDA